MPIARSVRITRHAISPRFATRTVENMSCSAAGRAKAGAGVVIAWSVISGSHPEEAEGGLRQRRAGDDVKGESENGACVRRVDHTVVPKARRGVVRAALVLVLLPDGGLKGFLILGGPLLA